MDKKKKQGLALLVMTAISFPVSATAQDKLEASVGADIVSQYIWRGQSLGNASIQPAVSIAYKGVSLSGWGSVEFNKENAREFDLTLGYALKGFSVSITDYWFDQGAGYFHYGARNTQHVFEAQIGYDFGFLAINWYTNFAGNDGIKENGDRAYSSYFEISAPFKLGGLDWTAEIGAVPWETSFYNFVEDDRNGARGFEVSNIGIGVSKGIKITDSYSLPIFGKFIWNPATEGAHFVVGLSL